jgi:hypothetical protein
MVYLRRKPDTKIYFVGWTAHGSKSGVFWDVSVPGGGLRIMNKCVHQAALESAGMKLRELSHGSGGRSVPCDARTGSADRRSR